MYGDINNGDVFTHEGNLVVNAQDSQFRLSTVILDDTARETLATEIERLLNSKVAAVRVPVDASRIDVTHSRSGKYEVATMYPHLGIGQSAYVTAEHLAALVLDLRKND